MHGSDSLAPFILRSDKQLLFGAGGVLAFGTFGRTVIVSGDPVGPPGTAPILLGRLLERARPRGERVVIYGASSSHLELYRSLGMHAVCTGEEAVVDPAAFTLEGRAVRKLRQSVHRADRRGWRIEVRQGCELDWVKVRELHELDVAWRAENGEPRGFAMAAGRPSHRTFPDDVFALAYSPDGRLAAAIRFLAYRRGLSLDTVQRVGETTNGLGEALICHLLEWAQAREVDEVSLNYAGLGHLVRGAPRGGFLRRAVTKLLLRVLHSRFQMDRLVRFNEKFDPQWRPRYLVCSSRAALPLAAKRVLQAEGYLRAPRAGEDGPRRRGREAAPGRTVEQPQSV